MRRVVITGVGAISPCGTDTSATWDAIQGGRSGIRSITAFDASAHASRIAGECWDFSASDYIEKKRLREGARFIHLAVGASDQAVRHAELDPSDAEKERIGTFIGAGFCGIDTFEATCRTLDARGPRRVTPYFIPSTIANLAPGQVSMRFGFRGPSYTHASACASGAHAIGDAARWIQLGKIDAAVAGGTEAAVTPVGVAGFAAMRALSKRNDAPTQASRPFDAGRDGFVIAEGAGVLVLEELGYAKARGANILAELVGYGATSDAHHMTQPAPDGEGAQRAMTAALHDAGISADQVGYVNAHGTSTPMGDAQELIAVRRVFGAHATNGLAVSSTKSMTGHLLGAAGGLETVLLVKALQEQILPPTINLETPDEAATGMNLVPNEAQSATFEVAMSNSFGFGGTNCTLVLQRSPS